MAQQGDVQVHHRACVEGRPDPLELAARLVDLELASELSGFYRAAAEYARFSARQAWRRTASGSSRNGNGIGHEDGDWSDNAFAVRQAMAGWAIGTGDPDALQSRRRNHVAQCPVEARGAATGSSRAPHALTVVGHDVDVRRSVPSAASLPGGNALSDIPFV